jgi:hypothetical protein
MPLTPPVYADRVSQCVISIQSIDRDINIPIVLSAEQAQTWSDQDLTDRVTDLVDALKGFLTPTQTVQIDVSWQGNARMNLIRDLQTIEDPNAEPPAAPVDPPVESPPETPPYEPETETPTG